MGYKSRGNFKMSKCLDTCKCRTCRGGGELAPPQVFDKSPTKTSYSVGIVVNTSFANDGSKFEKQLSQTYYDNIRNRKFNEGKFQKPSQYGSGRV